MATVGGENNWDGVDAALTILNDAQGLGIGARHITVSTVGIVPRLVQLAARHEREAQSLASITGWDIQDIRRKMDLGGTAPEPGSWWERLWKKN